MLWWKPACPADGLLACFNLAHEQIRFLAREAFHFSACKFRHVNSESAMAQAQLALKGNGRWDSDWFIARYAQNTPITH